MCPYLINEVEVGLASTTIAVLSILLVVIIGLAVITMALDPTEPLVYGEVSSEAKYEFQ